MSPELPITSAEDLVATLGVVDPRSWRAAAMATIADPGFAHACQQLAECLPRVDQARWWLLEDDLESALYRLTTHEAVGVVHGPHDYQRIAEVTRGAVAALALEGVIGESARHVLTGRFMALG